MKRIFHYAGALLLACFFFTVLYSQDSARQVLPQRTSFRLSSQAVQHLVWQTPGAAPVFTARDLLMTSYMQSTPLQFSWWKDINNLYQVSIASKALALGLSVGSAFTPYSNVSRSVQENNANFYRQSGLYKSKTLDRSYFGNGLQWEP